MNITLLILSVLYLVITAYLGYAAIEKLKKADIGERERVHRYRFSIVWNSISALSVLAVVCFSEISLSNIGFRKITINFVGAAKVIAICTLVICGLLAAIFVYQMVSFAISKKYQATMKVQMESRAASGSLYDRTVSNLIPRTKREKRWFFATSLAAGICEEMVFRGFLLFLLGLVFSAISPYLLVIMIGVLFGSAHFYQGMQGICKTAAIGMLFGFLYVCTDSLYPCILLHFLFDVSSVYLYPSTKIED